MNTIIFGCLIDKHKFAKSLDTVEHSILCLQDKELNSTEIVKTFNQNNKPLNIHVFEIQYSFEETIFYVLGFEFNKLDKTKSLNDLTKNIEDECFRFCKQRPTCKLYSFDEESEYQVY